MSLSSLTPSFSSDVLLGECGETQNNDETSPDIKRRSDPSLVCTGVRDYTPSYEGLEAPVTQAHILFGQRHTVVIYVRSRETGHPLGTRWRSGAKSFIKPVT